MLGIISDMVGVATGRSRQAPSHEDMRGEHERRKAQELRRWKAHAHWFDRDL